MEKNKWIVGLLIVLILFTFYIDLHLDVDVKNEKDHIEGFNDGQTSIITHTNIQQSRGKMANQLYIFLFVMLLIIILSILYITCYIHNGTTLDDIYINLSSSYIFRFLYGILDVVIIKNVIKLIDKLGWFLFALFIFFVLYSFSSASAMDSGYSLNIVNMVINIVFICILFVVIMMVAPINNDSYPIVIFNILCFLTGLGLIATFSTIDNISILNHIMTVFGMFILITIFYVFSNQYLYLLDLFRAGSLMVFGIVFLIFISVFLHFILEGNTKEDSMKAVIIMTLISLYFILFVIHFVYYHGFLYTKKISFLKKLPLPIMDSTKLKKTPLYIFCEGILFEPFYKIAPLKNRTVIENWHKKFSNLLGGSFDIEYL